MLARHYACGAILSTRNTFGYNGLRFRQAKTARALVLFKPVC